MRFLFILVLFPTFIAAQGIAVQPERFLADREPGVAPTPVFTIDKDDTTLFGAGKQPKFVLPASTGAQGFVFLYCPICPEEYAIDSRVLIYFTDIGQPGMRAYVDRNYNYDYTDDDGFVA